MSSFFILCMWMYLCQKNLALHIHLRSSHGPQSTAAWALHSVWSGHQHLSWLPPSGLEKSFNLSLTLNYNFGWLVRNPQIALCHIEVWESMVPRAQRKRVISFAVEKPTHSCQWMVHVLSTLHLEVTLVTNLPGWLVWKILAWNAPTKFRLVFHRKVIAQPQQAQALVLYLSNVSAKFALAFSMLNKSWSLHISRDPYLHFHPCCTSCTPPSLFFVLCKNLHAPWDVR